MTNHGGGTPLPDILGIRHPIIGGAMYPCSNPELVAAVSSAGGIGVLQPVSLVYVHGWELRDGIRRIRSLTDGPVGMNVLTHKITGVPVSVIRTSRVEREGTEAGRFEHWLLTHPRVKHWARAFYSLRSAVRLKRASNRGVVSHRDYLQAGKSVAGIHRIATVAEIIDEWVERG